MKKVFLWLLTVFILAGSFALCAVNVGAEEPSYEGIDRSCAGQTITVYNWGEYISDGEEGSLDVVAKFEEITGIDVNYVTYANNEELYAKLSNGGTTYDIVVPSDYMFERLLAEGFLAEIDYTNIPNYKYIDDAYKGIFEFDMKDAYSIPYTVGMVGVIYNTKIVKETPTNWDILWDEKYDDQILMFDNPRDAFAIAQFKLGIDINTTDKAEWERAAEALKDQKSVLKRYVNDEVFDIMEDGNAAVAPYYAGDYLTMYQENNSLAFYYPRNEKGEIITNQFIDVMCITKASVNKKAAEMFINFMLEPEIAIANAEMICYASPNKAVVEDEGYRAYLDDLSDKAFEILYPEDFTSFSSNSLVFRHLSVDILDHMNELWSSNKAEGVNAMAIYIVCGVIVLAIVVLVVLRMKKKRTRRLDSDYYA